MDKSIPQYLFHYTSIRGLALILKSKKIRLRALSYVDDVSEAESRDLVNFGQYIFVTCWTSLEEESIPFWHIYTDRMQGVRIKMPRQMFRQYPVKDIPEYGASKEGDDYFALPFERMLLKNHLIMPDSPNNFFPVEYTDNVDLLYRSLHKKKLDGGHSVALGEMGKYKSSHWKFQSEWRLRFIILPGTPLPKDIATNKSSMESYLAAASGFLEGRPLGFDEYYLELDDDAFQEMEITLGPKQRPGDKVIIEALAKELNPGALIKESSLMGKIR